MAKYSKFRQIINWLKKEFASPFPVTVRRIPYKTLDGLCTRYFKPNRFKITICNKLSEQAAIDCLLHEWAHLRSWNLQQDYIKNDKHAKAISHSSAWGCAFAEIYSAYETKFCDLINEEIKEHIEE